MDASCVECGNGFHTRSPKSAKYCSSACKWLARKRRDGVPCEVCGEPTGWTRASGKTSVTHKACGRQVCGTIASYRRGCRCGDCRAANTSAQRAYTASLSPRARIVRSCDQCGTEFNPRANQARCSSECMRAWRAGNKAARRGAGRVEAVDPIAVYDRDGWVCGICELPVDPLERFPSPGAATLDHVIPISHDGDHIESNLQCAHFYCNTVKGNRQEAMAC